MSMSRMHHHKTARYTRHYTPRHSLAKHIIDQMGALALRAQDIVCSMGYLPVDTISACDRLRHVLSSEILGLNDMDVDRYFTAHAFLMALLQVLDMADPAFLEDIAHIEYDLAQYPYPLPKYHLRAKIDCAWTKGANWLSRGAASNKANVHMPNGIAKISAAECEKIVQKHMNMHYKKYNGRLPYDGVIQGYQLTVTQRQEVLDSKAYGLPT